MHYLTWKCSIHVTISSDEFLKNKKSGKGGEGKSQGSHWRTVKLCIVRGDPAIV